MKRRHFILSFALAAAAPAAFAQATPLVEIWRSPGCGCCGAWVKHLQQSGFATRVHMVDDTSVMRRSLGIPDAMGACHSARVGGYAIEGHVPASDIRRLLAERPKARGLAVPGMPPGSPGMDVSNSPPFEVLLMDGRGGSSLYARHTPR